MEHMKTIGLLLVMCLLFCACGGRTGSAQLVVGDSVRYQDTEIRDAMEQVMKQFRSGFRGCKLTELVYDETFSDGACEEWAAQYDAAEAIILTSTFEVGARGDGSLTPNSTYGNWQWILVRDEGGPWVLKTWGYG